MKNLFLLVFALVLIGMGIFLGLGLRTPTQIVEKPHEVALIEKRS